LQLRAPKLRQGSYFPPFLEPRKVSERALVAVIQEAWVGGVSTRRVDELVEAMGLSGIGKSTVSKPCREIDERVQALLGRPLGGEWPYLWRLDAAHLKMREGGRAVSVATMIAAAVDTGGRREIVGLGLGPSEAEASWSAILKGLLKRSPRGIKLVISDTHEGLRHAIAWVLGAAWRHCRVHWMGSARGCPGAGRPWPPPRSAKPPLQADRAGASQVWRQVADRLRPRWPRPAALKDGSGHEVLAYTAFPTRHRTKLRSTIPLERLNGEVRRHAGVVGIFPGEPPTTGLSAPCCRRPKTSGSSGTATRSSRPRPSWHRRRPVPSRARSHTEPPDRRPPKRASNLHLVDGRGRRWCGPPRPRSTGTRG
jgi:putative transposase